MLKVLVAVVVAAVVAILVIVAVLVCQCAGLLGNCVKRCVGLRDHLSSCAFLLFKENIIPFLAKRSWLP